MRRKITARRNPRGAKLAPKDPTVVLVRRFDPTGETLPRWEILARDEDGQPEFFSPPAAKKAALTPPHDADLHVGDLIVTVPVEALSDVDNQATTLLVVTPVGVKSAPWPPAILDGRWLAMWGQNAREMLRASHNVNRKLSVMAACDCAETVLHLVPTNEGRPRRVLEMARAWCRNDVSTDDVMEASANVWDIANAYHDDKVAFTAVCAAAGAAATSGPGASADAAAEYAALAVYEHSGADYKATLRALAPLVERWIPLPVALLSALGYPLAIPFDPGLVSASSSGTRENPLRPSRRRSRR